MLYGLPLLYQSMEAILALSRNASLNRPQKKPVRSQRSSGSFDICVIGLLRAVKDPFRAAMAARVPSSSRIRVLQVGRPLLPAMARLLSGLFASQYVACFGSGGGVDRYVPFIDVLNDPVLIDYKARFPKPCASLKMP